MECDTRVRRVQSKVAREGIKLKGRTICSTAGPGLVRSKVWKTYIKGMRMNSFNVMNLALFGIVFLLLHFGKEAESSSTCSLPGLPGRDGLPGQPGRDGRDGSSGPVGPPGGKQGLLHKHCDMPAILTQLLHVE